MVLYNIITNIRKGTGPSYTPEGYFKCPIDSNGKVRVEGHKEDDIEFCKRYICVFCDHPTCLMKKSNR